ncbi:uncharacterized protein LOC122577387 isoform X1 [Bombus pyrosoma]|uniref:uncharacterized protein LOC122577387 isoform X1 n=1 Tax=Bombus pyrosoma TaxID=396416 RepID=UPI001CB8EE57|nr:uncharacterized protein LOC122577387 isoform X1 [Bombus pyrosoma]
MLLEPFLLMPVGTCVSHKVFCLIVMLIMDMEVPVFVQPVQVCIILFILTSSSFLWCFVRLSAWSCMYCFSTRGEEIPKMCGWLVKMIQMNVRRLTSLRRLLPESWMFSCVTALLVGAIFSAVCSQYMERLREMSW